MTDLPPSGDDESNRFGGRIGRYARVGAATSGLAARLAGKQLLGGVLGGHSSAEATKLVLGNLKGPLMKAAQILATFPDVLPEEYARELRELQSNAPAMGRLFVKRRMQGELGPHWRDLFREFSLEATAAASLGQVHRAVGRDGRDLACKLQYPDMTSVVEADLNQLRLALGVYWRVTKTIDPGAIFDELSERMREELDYSLEARNITLYRHMLRDEPGVHVPEFYPDQSTKRLLTMSWLDGRSLLAIKDHSLKDRKQVALNMFRAWYRPFYGYGVIHGDPHLGNYAVRGDHTINLLDFGCIRIFPPSFVKGVIDLYRALRDNNRDMAAAAYESWGFNNLNDDLIEALNLWAQFVYAPLMEDGERLMRETNSVARGAATAGHVRERLRRLGGVRLPREFVLMDRAALGLGSVFLHLGAEMNWHRLFHDLIEDFDVQRLATRQAEALVIAGLEDSHPR